MSGVVLPYGTGAYDITLLEVKKGVDFGDALASLASGDFPVREGTVKGVSMPKFSINSNSNIAGILEGLGVKRVFTPELAELTNLSSSHCYLSCAQHAVRIELAEEGTVAAAATVATGMATSLGGDGKWFTFNRPFIFYITERSSGAILFVGKVVSL
ncbi:MAG: serpin family protein, partial [Duncaniella sp.]|nr:serpin family protein [Duncaniella sp.]